METIKVRLVWNKKIIWNLEFADHK